MRNILNSLILAAFLLLLVSCGTKQLSMNLQKPGYKLVWHDEFNSGAKPDTLDWSYEHGLVRNEELQWYQESNAKIKDGSLIIEGRKERVKNFRYDSTSDNWRRNRRYADYTSSSINTRGKQAFKYGIIEVRARIDTAKGMWPAIWTLGSGSDHHWPANGEVDIMEFYRVKGQPTILANAAWGGENHQAKWNSKKTLLSHFLQKDSAWPKKFHTWKMDWTSKYIKIYLDDELLNEIDLSKTHDSDGFNPFHQPHYILLNLALGSNGGDPSETAFLKKYEVDYVRVYQKNN